MRLTQIIQREPAPSEKPKRKKSSVAGHRVFVPMLTIWGAALLGLCIVVLPQSLINQIGAASGIGSLGGLLRFALAGLGAVIGAALTFIVGKALNRRALKASSDDNPIVSSLVERRVRPIDPASDLGLISLDAPLEETQGDEPGDSLFCDNPADLDAEFEEVDNEDLAALVAPENSESTLGELSDRGYDIDLPDGAIPDLDEVNGLAFTHKDFSQALIENCESADCEASGADVPESDEADDETPAPLPVTTQARENAEPRPIGRAGGGGSWSLTQFAPQEKPAQSPQESAEPPVAEEVLEHAEEEAAPADAPLELDLAEFAELPGRNAVWVEEDVGIDAENDLEADSADQEQGPEPLPQQPSPVPATALDKLRQRPANELSLVEMVERFAGALHEHQQSERSQAEAAHTGRDAALAEALKALTLFTEAGFDRPANAHTTAAIDAKSDLNKTEEQLRDALAKLQTLRGAA